MIPYYEVFRNNWRLRLEFSSQSYRADIAVDNHSLCLGNGALKDPSGAVISGLQIELLAGKKVFRKLRTSNQGTFDFEEIPSGRYRIRVRHRGFCAPEVECGTGGCTVKPYLRIEQMS